LEAAAFTPTTTMLSCSDENNTAIPHRCTQIVFWFH
jgi:hypothetical protein